MNKKRKSSMIDLPMVLETLNREGKYDHMINRAKEGGYHDFKFIELPAYNDCICPKMELVDDLSEFPELSELRSAVIHGEYDDEADEEDKVALAKELDGVPMGEVIKKALGLE